MPVTRLQNTIANEYLTIGTGEHSGVLSYGSTEDSDERRERMTANHAHDVERFKMSPRGIRVAAAVARANKPDLYKRSYEFGLTNYISLAAEYRITLKTNHRAQEQMELIAMQYAAEMHDKFGSDYAS